MQVLEAGAAVLWADVDAVLASDPFPLLAADSDVEALSEHAISHHLPPPYVHASARRRLGRRGSG